MQFITIAVNGGTSNRMILDPNNMSEESSKKNPVAKNAKKIPHHYKLAQQDEDKSLEQSEDKGPEPPVKREEEDQNLGMMIDSVTEGQMYKKEETGAFNILEKGNIYFFYRHRVSGVATHGIHDIARSFVVLRPASPETASDVKNNSLGFGATFRLLVFPKKVLPKHGGVKEMGFVEKAQITLKELQEAFITGFDYKTHTHGARTVPDAKLYAKGVYTITSTQHGSYLAYIITEPKKLGTVQEEFGLHERGSWLVQSKNPKVSNPPSVSLPNSPNYPESFGEKFGHYRWIPLHPKLIDYPNAQFILIGRSHQNSIGLGNVKNENGENPEKQLEDMAHNDKMRKEQFRGVDPVYGDLDLEVNHYLKISTTWDHP